MDMKNYEFWFVTGSQFLYGEEQLKSVAADAEDIVNKLNESGNLPYKVAVSYTHLTLPTTPYV